MAIRGAAQAFAVKIRTDSHQASDPGSTCTMTAATNQTANYHAIDHGIFQEVV